MKNHREMFEALLAGETLVSKNNPHRTICFENNHLSLFGFNDYNLALIPYGEFQIKPKTININGIEVPEPLREIPELGKAGAEGSVYVVSLSDSLTCRILVAASYLGAFLERGLCHKTKEAAELHAKALLSFTKKD